MDLIAEIKSRLTIEEYFSYVFPGTKLTRRGNRLWAYCPFHQERTPSFCIDIIKQRFVCYGCNQRGDVIDLYALVHNIEDGGEAIRRSAAELGITRKLSHEERKAALQARQKRKEEKTLNTDLENLVKETRLDTFNISHWFYLIQKHITNERDLKRIAVIWALKNQAYIDYLADTFVSGTEAEQLQAALAFRRWKQSQPILKH